MSSDNAITVNSLNKCYQIYDQPRDRLLQMLFRGRIQYCQDFWALKDISLEIKKGETIGIIGRNGSGKSTLLQIICGTLNPTSGSVLINGKVAALLELGSGFNPEFSGRENVYLNGALLGLTKEEINERFDDISAFADIGEFIDQPVKLYSSGMYVRLAFAIIAHVDADILLIDEALAVGDAVFVQKCMRFIRKFKETGTLLFVSHDIHSVLNICDRSVWLHCGLIREVGNAKKVSESYLQYTLQEVYGQAAELKSVQPNTPEYRAEIHSDTSTTVNSNAFDYGSCIEVSDNLNAANGWKSGAGEILYIRFERADHIQTDVFKGGEEVRVIIEAMAYQTINNPILGFLVRDRLGQDLFGENTLPATDLEPQPIAAGSALEGEFVFTLPMLPNGQYSVVASLAEGDLTSHIQHHWLHDSLIINVSSSKVRWGLVGLVFNKVKLRERK